MAYSIKPSISPLIPRLRGLVGESKMPKVLTSPMLSLCFVYFTTCMAQPAAAGNGILLRTALWWDLYVIPHFLPSVLHRAELGRFVRKYCSNLVLQSQ